MSKSQGNVIAPQRGHRQARGRGAAAVGGGEDYRDDIRLSEEILTRLAEGYRRIRNTCRYLLGNLADFDPARDAVPAADLLPIDRFILHRLQRLIERVRKAYEDYEFHVLYHGLHNFCAVDLSAFYLDVLKDRLYTSAPKSPVRRSAQTALHEILVSAGEADGAGPLLHGGRGLATHPDRGPAGERAPDRVSGRSPGAGGRAAGRGLGAAPPGPRRGPARLWRRRGRRSASAAHRRPP